MSAPLLITLLLTLLGAARAQEAPGPSVALENPGFEGAYKPIAPTSGKAQIRGELAGGWQDNSDWAEVSVDYARDAVNPHRGQAAQRVSVTRVAGGAVQLVQGVSLRKGRVYEWRVWLRGRPGAGVTLSLRQAGAPYAEYASMRAGLAAEWQEFRVLGPCSEDTAGFLMVRATEPAVFWVDDARLFDVTGASSGAAPRRGNLVTGSSFETGLVPFGWSVRYEGSPRHRWSDPRPRIDGETAAHGRRSLRCDAPAGADIQIRSPLLTFNVSRPHAASVWLKASAPDTDVQVQLENTDLQRGVKIGTDWQRVTLAGTLPYRPWTRLRISTPERERARTLWVDGAMLEERAEPSADYVPAAPHDVALLLPRPGRIVFDGERARALVSTTPGLPPGARLRRSVLDLYGTTHKLPDLPLPAASFPLPDLRPRSRGVFKMRAEIVDRAGRPLSSPIEMIWARLPRPRPVAPEKSFFGLHVPLAPDFVRAALACGVKWTRLHDTSMVGKWAVAEPERGRWEFYDDGITGTRRLGLAILGMLDGAPGWAATKPREGYWGIWHIPDAPGAPEAWERYVRTVVGHYRGRIDHWEVWNEPWGNWFLGAGGSPALYGDLLRRAYPAAHAANPNAVIVGIDTYAGHDDTWTLPVLRAAGPAFYDVFSFHDYSDALYGGPNSLPAQRVRSFAGLQKQFGPPRPQWNTEGGLFQVGSFYAPITGGMPARAQVGYIVRYDVSYLAAGVRRFFLYALHTDPPMGGIETVTTEHDRAVKPILAARAILAYLVDGAGRPSRSEPRRGVDAYAFPDRRVTVLWSHDGEPHALPIPSGARALDALGNPLSGRTVTVGPEPIYFVR